MQSTKNLFSKNGWRLSLLILFFCFVSLPLVLIAQEAAPVEKITSFDTEVVVQRDGTLSVREVIQYDFGDQIRRGIFREIPKSFRLGDDEKNYRLIIEDVQVESPTAPEDVSREDIPSDYIIRIGNPDITISGVHEYVISYTAKNAINFFENFDEVYWNATGNEWPVPIESASLTVRLPGAVEAEEVRTACYVGVLTSRESCDSTTFSGESYTVRFTEQNLQPGEGLTGAVGFPKGFVPETERALVGSTGVTETMKYVGAVAIFLSSVGFFLYSRSSWLRHRRGAQERYPIVRQYDAPEGLSPLEVGFLVDKYIHNHDVTAEIVYLAEQGFIHIISIPKKILFLKRGTQFYILKMKEHTGELKEYQSLILDSLFSSSYVLSESERSNLIQKVHTNQDIVTDKSRLTDMFERALEVTALKELEGSFYVDLEKIKTVVRAEAVRRGFVKHNNLGAITVLYLFSLAFIVVSIVFIFIFIQPPISAIRVLMFIISIILFFVQFRFYPLYKKTEQGAQLSEHALGLKEYLSIAEKDRLEFHFNPKNNPELFEKLLPYAIALGVDKQWAQELDGLHIEPDWYTDASNTHFTVDTLQSSFSGFTSGVNSSYASPSSSGSGGGGFSGGGSGGGGGGSW